MPSDDLAVDWRWLDPNAWFAETSGYADFTTPHAEVPKLDGRRFPVILELAAGHAPVGGLRNYGIPVPEAYPVFTRYCTARLNRAQYLDLIATGFGRRVLRWELQMPVVARRPQPDFGVAVGLRGTSRETPSKIPPTCRSRAMETPPHKFLAQYISKEELARDSRKAVSGLTSSDLIAVIDTGCPFAHQALAVEDGQGTRIVHLWDQDEIPAFGPLAGARMPGEFGYGAEVDRDSIDTWVATFRDASGAVDEAECYRQAEYHMVDEGFGHGSAILGIAAGRVPLSARYPQDQGDRLVPPTWAEAHDPASRADLVFVQLPRGIVEDSSSAGLARHLLDGLRYVVARAAPSTRRIVVNVSDGTSRNLHDGSSIIERAMVDLIEEVDRLGQQQLQIVVAAGNAYSDQRHAQVQPRRKTTPHDVWVNVPPDSETPQFLNIRIPVGMQDLALRVTPPGGASPVTLTVGSHARWPSDAKASCWLVIQPRQRGHATQGLIAWAPTSLQGDDPRARARPGNWRIECLARGTAAARAGADERVEFWISLNQQNNASVQRSRQARFVDADGRYDPQRYLRKREDDEDRSGAPTHAATGSVIRRRGTLSGLATGAPGQGVWVVGSEIMRVTEGRPARSLYSSAGPAAGPKAPRQDVDRRFATDFTRTSPGIRVNANLGGEVVRATGTSFAAPQWVRRLLQDDGLWERKAKP